METKKLRLDIIALVLSVLSFASSIVLSLYTHADSAYREARKPFFEQQLKQYVEAADVASKIAAFPHDHAEWKDACHRLKQLHWGGMYLVESKQVEMQMLELDRLLTQLDVLADPPDSSERELIRHEVARLTRLMYEDIKKSWALKCKDDPRVTDPAKECKD